MGDIFVLQVRKGEFILGRVVTTNARLGGFDNVILIYIYQTVTKKKSHIPPLKSDKLLIPPLGTNQQPWLRGYFQTVAHEPLREKDVLRTHCFRDALTGKYLDEQGRELEEKVEPCGEYGVASYRMIDYEVSKALGLPIE